MKFGRRNPIGIALTATLWTAGGLVLASCSDPSSDEPGAVDPQTDTFAEILATDLRNPELSAALGDRIGVIRERGGSVSEEMLAAGFRRTKGEPGCETLAYEGEERKWLGIDRTVRITWKECAGAKAAESELVVNFGDA